MKKYLIVLLTLFIVSHQSNYADNTSVNDKETLKVLLSDFLKHQSLKHHNDFWADDLIYTSSDGTRFDKKFIMDGMSSEKKSEKDTGEGRTSDAESTTTFSAEEIDIRVYNKTAIVAFKLVGIEVKADTTTHVYYFNTGTFLKRNDQWQAVAWQATKIPNE